MATSALIVARIRSLISSGATAVITGRNVTVSGGYGGTLCVRCETVADAEALVAEATQ